MRLSAPLNPVLAMDQLRLPGRDRRLSAIHVTPEAVTLKAAGVLDAIAP